MLSLTRRVEYALMAVCHLCGTGGRFVSAREISASHSVPQPLVTSVLKHLARCGYVRSLRGARGGYALNVDPERLSLAEFIEILDEPLRLVRCAGPEGSADCDLEPLCRIRLPLFRVHDRVRAVLDEFSIADIARDHGFRGPRAATDATAT